MYMTLTLTQAITLLEVGNAYEPGHRGYQVLLDGVLVDLQLMENTAEVSAPDWYSFRELMQKAQRNFKTLAVYK